LPPKLSAILRIASQTTNAWTLAFQIIDNEPFFSRLISEIINDRCDLYYDC